MQETVKRISDAEQKAEQIIAKAKAAAQESAKAAQEQSEKIISDAKAAAAAKLKAAESDAKSEGESLYGRITESYEEKCAAVKNRGMGKASKAAEYIKQSII